jgi:hypothetical protein
LVWVPGGSPGWSTTPDQLRTARRFGGGRQPFLQPQASSLKPQSGRSPRCEEWYYVTNQPLGKDWLAIYLQYERRWGIENEGFRQLKQRYHLEQLPGRSLNAIEARTALVLMLYNAMNIVQMKYPDDGLRALALQRKLGEPTPLAKVTLAVYIGQTMALLPGTEYQRLALIGERRRTLADIQAAVDGIELPAKLRAKLAKILQT